MTDRVKVGLNEWIAGDASRVDLMTDGLSGCVAVGLSGNGQLALSHVFSGCDASNWDEYRKQLDQRFEESNLGDPSKIKAVLVCNQGAITQGSNAWLPQQLKSWLAEKGIEATIEKDNGCRIAASDGTFACALKKDDNADFYRHDYKTSRDEGGGVTLSSTIVNQKITDADLGARPIQAALPSVRASAMVASDVLLSNEAHPAHGLYKDILAKLPEDSSLLIPGKKREECGGATLGAAALTVECMKRGIYDSVDSVFEKDEKTFAMKGEIAESRQFASILTDDVYDMAMKPLSGQAGKLHGERAPPAQNLAPQTVTHSLS